LQSLLQRYFDANEDEVRQGGESMAYQPAPGSPGASQSEDEDDLDLYMANIEVVQDSFASKNKFFFTETKNYFSVL
jgi:hypothetical protein